MNVPLQLHGFTTQIDFYLLDIKGDELVLGIQWLSTLGPIITDFQKKTLQFCKAGKTITLQGESLLGNKSLSISELHTLLAKDCVSYFYHLQAMTDTSIEDIPPDIQQLLSAFHSGFENSTALPPKCHIDHQIHLQPGAPPVNVKPYRYPYFQKQEIEMLVTDMLQTGVIKKSQSAFSSPVLLVKKKDGTWHFCVDYRAVNSIHQE